ncbi:MAG: dihydropteroate synthase [Pseudomonadota bacterium]
MSETVLTSASGKEWVMGFDRPFTIIGERINPTGRKILAEEMKNGDFSRVEADAVAQVQAGAHMLDVNAGIPLADEPGLLAKSIELVQNLCPNTPISIDSSIHEALEAGLAVCKGRPLLNSVTGETDRLEAVLPLVKKYDCAVVAISNDETGISEDPEVRYAVAKKIVEHAADHGIKPHDIVVDPLVMPIGALGQAGRQVFDILHKIRKELRCNTTCGASNISFGLPNRHGINAHFLAMAASHGMTSAIMNPLHEPEAQAIRAANVLMANDADCMAWIQQYREPPAAGSEGARGRRTSRRRRG